MIPLLGLSLHLMAQGPPLFTKNDNLDFDTRQKGDWFVLAKNHTEFRQASSHFIFMSGDLSAGKIEFMHRNALEFLNKPTSIRDIKICVQRVFMKDLAGQP